MAIASGAAALLMLVVVASKGINDRLQDWGVVYWWLDYSDGMIRRGLTGQLFQAVFGRLSVDALVAPVNAINLICIGTLALVMAALTGLTMSRLRPRAMLGFAALAVWLFVGQIWPHLVYNIGYLDTIVILMALGAALAVRQRQLILAGLIVAVGPFVHEYFVFLTPFIASVGLDEGSADASVEGLLPLDAPRTGIPLIHLILLGAVGVASGLLVVALSHPAAALAQLDPLPLKEALKRDLLATTLSQGMAQSVHGMLIRFSQEPAYAVANFAFFLAPALVACGGLVFWRAPRGSRVPWVQAAAALFPVAALLMAWDLSRLLVLTTFPAGVLFLLAAERRSRTVPQDASDDWAPLWKIWLMAGSILLAGAYACYPFTYTYFGARPNFRYFPEPFSHRIMQLPVSVLLEEPWGHRTVAFPAKDVTCDLEPAAQAGSCERLVQSGQMIYGPWLSMPLGNYRAQMQFRAPPGCANDIYVEVFDVKVYGRPLMSTTFRSGGKVTVTMDFQVSDDMAQRAPFEFRTLQSAGPACAVLEKVSVSKLSR